MSLGRDWTSSPQPSVQDFLDAARVNASIRLPWNRRRSLEAEKENCPHRWTDPTMPNDLGPAMEEFWCPETESNFSLSIGNNVSFSENVFECTRQCTQRLTAMRRIIARRPVLAPVINSAKASWMWSRPT
jgi:hypothetical protein